MRKEPPMFDEAWADGCTCAPDLDFEQCCVEHDMFYYYGDDHSVMSISRKEADVRLRKCIAKNHNTPTAHLWAWAYYFAVRIFGGKFWNGYRRLGDDYATATGCSIIFEKRVKFIALVVGFILVTFLGIFPLLWRHFSGRIDKGIKFLSKRSNK